MQKLWQLKTTWDEPLDDGFQAQWRDIATDLKATAQFSVSRRYFNVCLSHPTIHCFADASQHAYGAIVFLVQNSQVSFVIAKARVAPLKSLTIPRLELMAALVATRLTHFVLKAIPSDTVHMWSDSQIVLHWLNSQKPLPVFVRHRTAEIQSLLPQANWSYCPTSENPADLLSRGTTTEMLMSSPLWNYGPAWLTNPSQWPSFQLPPLPPLVLAAAVATEFVPAEQPPPNLGLHCIISVDRYSSFNKLLSVSAYVIRFLHNLKVQPQHRQFGPATAEKLQKVKLMWVKDTQRSTYWKEVNNLQLILQKPKTSRVLLVRQLRLFLDKDGLLRCGGRIHNAPLSEVTKFPYLLPARHALSKLVVIDLHIRLCHSGTTATLTALRQSYWIPAARQYIKSILHYCVVCRKVSGNSYPAPDPPPPTPITDTRRSSVYIYWSRLHRCSLCSARQ